MDSTSKVGLLALQCGKTLALEVYRSAAGFYLGTYAEDKECGFPAPFTRESQEYWPTAAKASAALESGSWTQRRNL